MKPRPEPPIRLYDTSTNEKINILGNEYANGRNKRRESE